ncbi:MAG: RNA ligase RtcB family protein [Nannocystis sp.]|uniref:RNA ligase RtcB family protein n=1 Tax=Nannocystis sp. TaxID=1962667 RepID=UPI002421F3A8|nr:RNA ligase RtcB family protein [Nannocystis sp.]MBK9756574.1 RNA ligase RtcB family protein [Nannocystis sp.]
MNQDTPAAVRVVASARTWIEGDAVQQLEATARLPGMRAAIGMPDLHPGKGSPIGAAFLCEGQLYPHLVGNDIGCGMGLWRTDLLRRKQKRDRWADRLEDLDAAWDGDIAAALGGLAASEHDGSLGTIGGGNHFAELQAVERVDDAAALAALGLVPEQLCLLVHSGSRGLGESILRAHVDAFAAAGLKDDSPAAAEYMARHDHAVAWARVNRAVIAGRFAAAIGAELVGLLDVCHNSVEALPGTPCCWLHRKGAAPSTQGPVVIPGSRGSFSYLVEPLPRDDAGLSLAHGAGRKWKRGDTKARLKDRYRPADLVQTALGSRVICEDRELLYEEAPEAYKDIDSVIAALLEAGLCRVIAVLRPVITYKTRRR